MLKLLSNIMIHFLPYINNSVTNKANGLLIANKLKTMIILILTVYFMKNTNVS